LPPAVRAASPRILLVISNRREAERAGGGERERQLHFAVERAIILQRRDLERAGDGAEIRNDDLKIGTGLIEKCLAQRFVRTGILEHAIAGDGGGFDAAGQKLPPHAGGGALHIKPWLTRIFVQHCTFLCRHLELSLFGPDKSREGALIEPSISVERKVKALANSPGLCISIGIVLS